MNSLTHDIFHQLLGATSLKAIPGSLVIHQSDGSPVITLNHFHPSRYRHLR